jgi:peptidoglycan hydrolase FlgJ
VGIDGLPGALSPLQNFNLSQREEEKLKNIDLLKGNGTLEERRQGLRKASKEFESIFIRQMISSMRKTIGEGGLLNKSNGEKIFEDMLDEEWAKKLASRGGKGSLSDILYRQLSRQMGLAEEEHDPQKGEGVDFAKLVPGTGTPPIGLPASGRKRP